MDQLALYGQFVLALAVVLALIGLLALGARRLGFAPRVTPLRGRRRLAIVEVMALDAKHRLVLVRRDATAHLLLLGATQSALVESGIAAPPVSDAAAASPPTTRAIEPR
jgi:flagellar protein FliO/FliZ